jgi:hypothetical protein
VGNIDSANLTGEGFSSANKDDKLAVRLIVLTAAEIASPPERVLYDTINLFKGPDDDVRYYSSGEALVPMNGASVGHVIEDDGTPVTQRESLNFTGGLVSVADAGGKTVVTVPMPDAADISIIDAGEHYTSDNVESALQEAAARIDDLEGAIAPDAEDIGATDAGGFFTGANLEAITQEIGQQLEDWSWLPTNTPANGQVVTWNGSTAEWDDPVPLTEHSELSGTSDADSHPASAISIADAGAYFTGANAETVTQEIGSRLAALELMGNDVGARMLGIGPTGNYSARFGAVLPQGWNSATLTSQADTMTVGTGFGGTDAAASGGAAYADTNVRTRSVKVVYNSTTSTAGSAAEIRSSSHLTFGDSAGEAGFVAQWVVGAGDTQAGTFFAGYGPGAANLNDIDPLDMTNIFGIGVAEGGTAFAVYHNDGSGQGVTAAMPSAWNPNDDTELYWMRLRVEAGGADAHIDMMRLSDGATQTISRNRTTDGNFPTVNSNGCIHIFRGNGTGTGTKTIVFGGFVRGDLRVSGESTGGGGGSGIDLANPDPFTVTQGVTAAAVTLAGTVTLDARTSNTRYGTLSGNTTFAVPSNGRSGDKLTVQIKQAASGGPYTVTMNASIKPMVGGATLVASTLAGCMDFLYLEYVDADAGWRYSYINGTV